MRSFLHILQKMLLPASLVLLAVALFKIADTAHNLLPVINGVRSDVAGLKNDVPALARKAGEEAGKGAAEGLGKAVVKGAATVAAAPVAAPAVGTLEVAKALSPQNAKIINKAEKIVDPRKWKF